MALRDHAPEIVVPAGIDVLPAIKTLTPKGYSVYSVDSSNIEVLKICFVFNAGVKYQSKSFQASAALNLMSEGTAKYDSGEIAEKLDFYGIYFDANIDRDYSIVTVCCLKKFLAPALDLLEEILCRPTFPEQELKIYSAKRIQSIKIEREKVDYQARELFAEALFGKNHPYGFIPDVEDYNRLETEDLKTFYKTHYTFGNSYCVVSGMVSPSDLEKIAAVADSLPEGETQHKCYAVDTKPANIYVEKQDALQSSLRIGKVLFNREHTDYIGMQVVATVLGGYFSSRIIRNIREDKGYTYGAFAGMVNMQDSGFFAVSSEVSAQFTEAAKNEIFKEIQKLHEEPVSAEELAIVKNVMIGDIMRVLDGPFGIADVTIENLSNGETNAYTESMIGEINAITPERIRELAIRYLQTDTLTTVVVGRL